MCVCVCVCGVPVILSLPGLLLGNVHVNEESVEPKMKHLLLQMEGGREEGGRRERGGGREGERRERGRGREGEKVGLATDRLKDNSHFHY